jgi:hypothetical protein
MLIFGPCPDSGESSGMPQTLGNRGATNQQQKARSPDKKRTNLQMLQAAVSGLFCAEQQGKHRAPS